MLYIRKITEEAWVDKPLHDSDSVSDLATQNHELSVWQVDDDFKNFEDSVLALALTRDKVCGIFVAVLDLDIIKSEMGWTIKVSDQPGETAYTRFRDQHKNLEICHLNEMGKLAQHINSLMSSGDSIKYVDELRLTELLVERIDSKEISEDDIKNKGKWWKAVKNHRNIH